MSDWKRSTQAISFEQMPIALKAEIQKHVERYQLGDILSEALMCIQTVSEKAKKGILGSREMVYLGAVVTPRWLIWAVEGTKSSAAVLSALLAEVVVQDYANTPFSKMISDSGIDVSGKFTDAVKNASAFIGLEDNAVGKKFKETVIEAVQNAKK
ncbi:MAG: hypothetical protein ACM3Y8_05645 [Byssovorax cruenta]